MQLLEPNIDSFTGGEAPRSRTLSVLTLLAVASIVFSYLGAYAVTGVLVAADILPAWPADQDPRPRNMMVGFVALLALFTLLSLSIRLLSSRQLRRIDAMADEA
jgi:hypothetical protein